ncbi:MAG: prolyl oligopeptidase family serine peptidase [Planctomycetes bacterium]|nr:prolyl oligopeptidase family serine peptidase [Planctomycetota bacterium]
MLDLFLALVAGTQVVRDWLVVEPTDRTGRRPFAPSAPFEAHLLARDAAPPVAGAAITGENGEERRWTARSANQDGTLAGPIGWAHARVESASRRVVLAKVSGAGRLFVNGAGFVGDLYAYGFGGVPVVLREGVNDVWVAGVRGSLRLEFQDVEAALVVGAWDHVVPDVVRGRPAQRGPLGFLVWNASEEALPVALVGGRGVDPAFTGSEASRARIPPLSPWRFTIPLDAGEIERANGASLTAEVLLGRESDARCERVEVPVRDPHEARRVAFTSQIDGALQWYALLPARERQRQAGQHVLLSLHGAGVDALNQARSYAQKPDIAVVCPTNRRPFGFDWQDWGRRDAYEALDAFTGSGASFQLAQPEIVRVACDGRGRSVRSVRPRTEPEGSGASGYRLERLVLTGHSMGGHGTWHLGVNDPDFFDALGPSAGWASFDSYGGRPQGALRETWHGADAASLTEQLLVNVARHPIFVLHGSADDNVPASEARALLARLAELGAEPRSHFQEGAGHWWDGQLSTGADCVDHPGILALFGAQREVDPLEFDWIGADPGVDSTHHWVEVLQPLEYGRLFQVSARRAADRRTIEVTTDNVRTLRIARTRLPLAVTLDGKSTGRSWPSERVFELTAAGWNRREQPLAGKTPVRCGPFKRAFDRRFVLVQGTAGDEHEDRELVERSRHDLLTWWYRANATAELVTDREFLASDYSGRNVILYGNRDTNAAWAQLVPASDPFDARRGELRLGQRTWRGDDLAALVVRPRADDREALVGLVADSGARGARLGYAFAPFVSGVGLPDYSLVSSAVLRAGDGGVLAAGWFDRDWQIAAASSVPAADPAGPR